MPLEKETSFEHCPIISVSKTEMFHTCPIKSLPVKGKHNALHHREENQTKPGFSSGMKQLPASKSTHCTFKVE